MYTRSLILPQYIEQERMLHTTNLHLANEIDASHLIRTEEDMIAVYNEIVALEEEYKMLLKSKETSEYHQQLELEKDRMTISERRAAIEDLNGQIAMYTSQAANVYNQNVEVLEKCRRLVLEVEDLRNKNLVLEKEGEIELEDQRKLEEEIKRQGMRKLRIQGECDALTREMEEKIGLLKVLEGQQAMLEKQRGELQKIRIVALNDNQALEKQKFEREVSFQKTQIALTESLKAKQEAKLGLQNLQNQNRVLEAHNAKLLSKLQQEVRRSTQAELKLKAQMKSHAIAEGELQKTIAVSNALKEENDQLAKRNLELTQNVEKQIKGIEFCELESSQLKEEINVFLACEDETRKLLNHRPPLETLISNTSQHIRQSGKLIQHLRR